MKKYLIPSFVAVLTMSAALNGSPGLFHQSEVPDGEYAVYSAVIADMFSGNKVTFDTQAKVRVLVIKDHTVSDPLRADIESQDWKYLKENFPSVSQEAINDFVAKNKEAHQLKDAFSVGLNHTMVKKDEINQMFKGGEGGWEEFYKRFPDSGGFVGISRAGFNPEMDQALVYMEHGCGGLCGTGHYLLLEKSDGKWKVANKFRAWIS